MACHVCCVLCVVRCVLFLVWCGLCVVWWLLYVVVVCSFCSDFSVVCCSMFGMCCRWCTARCVLVRGYCVVFAVCWLLFIVCRVRVGLCCVPGAAVWRYALCLVGCSLLVAGRVLLVVWCDVCCVLCGGVGGLLVVACCLLAGGCDLLSVVCGC